MSTDRPAPHDPRRDGRRWSSRVRAIGSTVGVLAAVVLVTLTGPAPDLPAIGIWSTSAGFVVTLGSVLVRRPVTGVVWNAVHGGVYRWRADGPVRRAHDLATAAAALGFGAWLVVQWQLLATGGTDGMDPARVVIGTALTVLAALLLVRAVRLGTKRLVRDDR